MQVYEISMSAIIRLECEEDCEKKGKELVEEEGMMIGHKV